MLDDDDDAARRPRSFCCGHQQLVDGCRVSLKGRPSGARAKLAGLGHMHLCAGAARRRLQYAHPRRTAPDLPAHT